MPSMTDVSFLIVGTSCVVLDGPTRADFDSLGSLASSSGKIRSHENRSSDNKKSATANISSRTSPLASGASKKTSSKNDIQYRNNERDGKNDAEKKNGCDSHSLSPLEILDSHYSPLTITHLGGSSSDDNVDMNNSTSLSETHIATSSKPARSPTGTYNLNGRSMPTKKLSFAAATVPIVQTNSSSCLSSATSIEKDKKRNSKSFERSQSSFLNDSEKEFSDLVLYGTACQPCSTATLFSSQDLSNNLNHHRHSTSKPNVSSNESLKIIDNRNCDHECLDELMVAEITNRVFDEENKSTFVIHGTRLGLSQKPSSGSTLLLSVGENFRRQSLQNNELEKECPATSSQSFGAKIRNAIQHNSHPRHEKNDTSKPPEESRQRTLPKKKKTKPSSKYNISSESIQATPFTQSYQKDPISTKKASVNAKPKPPKSSSIHQSSYSNILSIAITPTFSGTAPRFFEKSSSTRSQKSVAGNSPGSFRGVVTKDFREMMTSLSNHGLEINEQTMARALLTPRESDHNTIIKSLQMMADH